MNMICVDCPDSETQSLTEFFQSGETLNVSPSPLKLHLERSLSEMYAVADPWAKHIIFWHLRRYSDAMKVIPLPSPSPPPGGCHSHVLVWPGVGGGGYSPVSPDMTNPFLSNS